MTSRRLLTLAAACSAAMLLPAGAAGAQSPPTPVPPVSAGTEYTENVPTDRGGVSAGLGVGTVRTLPPDVLLAISAAGSDTEALTKIVTWSTYGAPPEPWPRPPVGRADVQAPGFFSALADTLVTPGGALPLALLAAFCAAVALVYTRRRGIAWR